MGIHTRVLTSMTILFEIILLAMFLRHRGIFNEDRGPIFYRLVIQVALAALISSSLARTARVHEAGQV